MSTGCELLQRLDGDGLGAADDADADVAEVVERLSIRTRSSRWRSIESRALGSCSRALSMLGCSRRTASASWLSASIAVTMSALLSSSWVIRSRIWVSTDFVVPSRPSRVLLSSAVIVLSWATPPPLRMQAERAEHLLDLGVAPGAARAGCRRRRRAARCGRPPAAARARRTSRRAGWSGGSRRPRCRAGRGRCAARASPRRA